MAPREFPSLQHLGRFSIANRGDNRKCRKSTGNRSDDETKARGGKGVGKEMGCRDGRNYQGCMKEKRKNSTTIRQSCIGKRETSFHSPGSHIRSETSQAHL